MPFSETSIFLSSSVWKRDKSSFHLSLHNLVQKKDSNFNPWLPINFQISLRAVRIKGRTRSSQTRYDINDWIRWKKNPSSRQEKCDHTPTNLDTSFPLSLFPFFTPSSFPHFSSRRRRQDAAPRAFLLLPLLLFLLLIPLAPLFLLHPLPLPLPPLFHLFHPLQVLLLEVGQRPINTGPHRPCKKLFTNTVGFCCEGCRINTASVNSSWRSENRVGCENQVPVLPYALYDLEFYARKFFDVSGAFS